MAFEAGRIMIGRINDLINENESFGFETTLATKSYKNKIINAQKLDYNVTLLFFWLNNVELAIEKVRTRVKEGGHNIPENIIKRRYVNGIKNLFEIYLPVVDGALIYDNSYGIHELIAHKMGVNELEVVNENKFNQLKAYYDKTR